jgi:hypothetical protein
LTNAERERAPAMVLGAFFFGIFLAFGMANFQRLGQGVFAA